MKVGYTLHYVRAGKLTGIERFSLGCATALAGMPAAADIRVLASASAARLLPAPLQRDVLPGDWRLMGEQLVLPAWAKWHRFDGIHVTAFGGAAVRPCPFVLTVYDSVFWDHPEMLSFLGRHYYRHLINGALQSNQLRALIFISSAARDAVRRHFPALTVPFAVVHAAAGIARAPAPRRGRVKTAGEYTVLSVGTIEPRKNLVGMARAIEQARARLPAPLRWMHAGRRGWLEPDDLRVLESQQVEELGVVSDDQLRALMADTDALLSLSHLEGFNLPLVEALGLGTPAVVSDLPVHREVAGAGGLYAAPGDAAAAARHLVTLLTDDTEWAARSALGWQHTAQFQASVVADRLLEVYRDAFR